MFHRLCILGCAGGALAALATRATAQTYDFTPFVGNASVLDHTNGTGTNARFFNPTSVAVDSSGNIYVADGGDHTIRKVTASGTVTTLAGSSGQPGSSDGTGSGALFLYPYAVAVDASGNVYVADSGNQNIRKITPGGTVTTLAGTAGVAGSQDGTANGALFNAPQGIAVDATGNVYVSDTNNCTIRKVTPTGVTTTIAGAVGQEGAVDGTGASARFAYPLGLATDASGNVYVADYDNSAIRKMTPAGVVSTLAGSLGSSGTLDGQGASARFNHPCAVAVDAAGNVYVADTSSQTMREISAAGNVTTLAGTVGIGGKADGSGAAASFFYPAGIAATASGTVYIADTGNHSIRAMLSPGVVTTLAGSAGQKGSTDGSGSAATFAYPYGVAPNNSSGQLYIADSGNNTIRVASSDGAVTTFAGTAGIAGSADGQGTAAGFNDPTGVAVDGNGNVFVADTGNSTIRRISPGGTVSTFAGAAGSTGTSDGAGTTARFNAPMGIAVDAQNNVYVADTRNNTIRKITPAGVVSTLAGSGGLVGSGDGAGGSARFNGPYAVAVDSAGNLYVADFFNGTIRKIDTTNTVSTLAGSAGNLGFADGAGSAAQFNQPYGVAVDGSGNIYVADTYNRAIRKVSATGTVTTLNGTETRFLYPQGIAMSSSGTIYVADGDNQDVSSGGVLSAPPSGTQVSSASATAGQNATFSVTVTGSPVSYQWQESLDGGATWSNISDGSAFSGSATATLTVSDVATSMNGDEFRAQLSNAAGSSDSGSGTLTVTGGGGGGVTGSARIINLSIRSFVGTGANAVTVGFFITGTGSKQMLIRGDGPTLASFGVTGVLANPQITLFNSSQVAIDTNTVWGGSASLSAVFASVGAFALPATSADSAIYTPLAAGTSYTAQISGVNGTTGVALAELYDADSGNPPSRLTNVSARALSGTGSAVLTAGIVIGGTGTETVLIRGIGPGLAQFNVPGVLSATQITLFDSNGNPIASNSGWGGTATLTAAFAKVGAFSIPANSADSAMLVSLPAGLYTVEVVGVNNATGVALVEVYEDN
jgi:DNA-binding beta-propeller fold protein YncE